MTAEKYVDLVVKQIQCKKEKREDIAKQLLAEITERVQQGEALETVLDEMGDAGEVAESFNETLSPKEKKQQKNKKKAIVLSVIALMLAGLLSLTYWALPKGGDIAKSRYFTQTELQKQVEIVIGLVEQEDYAALKELSTEPMKKAIADGGIEKAKETLGSDFGKRESIGAIYSQQVSQMGKIYGLSQVNVSYEHGAVTYTITFDKDMRLAGFYMK